MRLLDAWRNHRRATRRKRELTAEFLELAHAYAELRRQDDRPFGTRSETVDRLEAAAGPRRPQAAAKAILDEMASLIDELDGVARG